jgi:hypothetical protein
METATGIRKIRAEELSKQYGYNEADEMTDAIRDYTRGLSDLCDIAFFHAVNFDALVGIITSAEKDGLTII